MKTILNTILCAGFFLIIILCYVHSCAKDLRADKAEPVINKISRLYVIEYADTTRFCDADCQTFFSVCLTKPVDRIRYYHHCANCGALWGRHKSSYEWTLETTPYN